MARCGTSNSTKELVIYVCNPTTKKWIALRPTGCDVGGSFGLVFHPFGTLANGNNPCFKLVSIQRSKVASDSYSFVVYSSETGKWMTSMEVCHCHYRIHKNRMVVVGNKFHWLTRDHHIVTFDVESEVSGVIKLPGRMMEGEVLTGISLGSSDGYFHYICVNRSDVQVWMLKDYCEPVWVLKHCLNLVEFCNEYPDILGCCNVESIMEKCSQPDSLQNTGCYLLLSTRKYCFSI